MNCFRPMTRTINKIEELSEKLDPKLEPILPNKAEEAAYISACWPMNFSNDLKELLNNAD